MQLITVHSGGGSSGEAMDPQCAVLIADEAVAREVEERWQANMDAYDGGESRVIRIEVDEDLVAAEKEFKGRFIDDEF